MPKTIKKSHFEEKICAACGLKFVWRKKWEKDWDWDRIPQRDKDWWNRVYDAVIKNNQDIKAELYFNECIDSKCDTCEKKEGCKLKSWIEPKGDKNG